MNIILGSGVIGLMAKDILGYDLIPFGRSRFYSISSFDDNYISSNVELPPSLVDCNDTSFEVTSISYCGNLIKGKFDDIIKQLVQDKLFDGIHPAFNSQFLPLKGVYKTTIKDMYTDLLQKYNKDINNCINKYGNLISIDKETKKIETTTGTYEYDNIISTIPLNALGAYIDVPSTRYSNLWVYEVYDSANEIDIEGSTTVYVADKILDLMFVRQSNIFSRTSYKFFTRVKLNDKTKYIQALCNSKNVGVLRDTEIVNAYPSCSPPSITELENNGILCVGKHAQCDFFMDAGSSLKKLYKIKEMLTS
jgi:hypothetical protein